MNALKQSTKKKQENLTVEQETLLEKEYKGFARNGALLKEDKKNKLREIDIEIAKLNLTFGENVLADTHAYELPYHPRKRSKGIA